MADIKCAGGCETILGNIELEINEEYRGDSYYGMYCENCPLPVSEKSELDLLKEQIQKLIDKQNNV